MFDVGVIFGTIFSALMGVGPHTERLPVPEYTCDPAVWTEAPVIKSNHFEGTISVACRIRAEHGGGFEHLRPHMEDYLVNSSETVHKGPLEQEYKGMPGVFYDVTMLFSEEGEKDVRIRGENHIASDLENVLRYDFFSKKITAEGMSKYMRVVNIFAEVEATEEEGWYVGTVSGQMKVEKPFFAPAKMFKNQVMEQVETRIESRKEEVVTEIANNI